MKISTSLRLSSLILLIMFSLSGCGGGGASSTMENRSTTTGQELLDLDKAHKQGIITQKEYDQKKKEIMKRK